MNPHFASLVLGLAQQAEAALGGSCRPAPRARRCAHGGADPDRHARHAGRQDRRPAGAGREPAAGSGAHRAPLPLRADRCRAPDATRRDHRPRRARHRPGPGHRRLRRRGQQHPGQRRPRGRRPSPAQLEALGLGSCAALDGVAAGPAPDGGLRRLRARAAPGKDSTTGHWEICGLVLDHAVSDLPGRVSRPRSSPSSRGAPGAASWATGPRPGTAVLDEYGEEHQRTGNWIVYTSADSVFQVAAHEETVPLAELYAACAAAREMLQGEHGVSRVIARPFTRASRRLGAHRRTGRTSACRRRARRCSTGWRSATFPRVGVGKVDDLFAGRGITSIHTATNAEAYCLIEGALRVDASRTAARQRDRVRPDLGPSERRARLPRAGCCELDRALPRLLARVRDEDLVIFTADHGNDPTTPSTDHSREVVPLLVVGPASAAGRSGPAPHVRRHRPDRGRVPGACRRSSAGTSFLSEVWRD